MTKFFAVALLVVLYSERAIYIAVIIRVRIFPVSQAKAKYLPLRNAKYERSVRA